MRKYEKPVLTANEYLAEGVYAASGANPECWTVEANSAQDWNGSHHVFEVHAVHSATVKHISASTTVTLKFSSPIIDAYSEFSTTFSDDTVTVVRNLLADAYMSGDNYTYKVWVQGADEAITKTLSCTSATITCEHQTNVQGDYD